MTLIRRIILSLITFGVIHQNSYANWRNPIPWYHLRANSTDFFDRNGWQGDSCATHFANDGSITSQERAIVSTARKIYGYAYSGKPALTGKAHLQANFILEKMLVNHVMIHGQAHKKPYFLESFDPSVPTHKDMQEIQVHKQAYGLMGLVALYHLNPSRSLMNQIQEIYSSFLDRFYDEEFGGFYDRFDLSKNSAIQTKSFASSVYVLTALLFPLSEIPFEFNFKYKFIKKPISELGDILINKFYDEKTGWIREEFTRQWDEDWRERKDGAKTITIVGHNMQFAWTLLRLAQQKQVYFHQIEQAKSLAKIVIESVIKNGGVDLARGGFYNGIIRETNQLKWGSDKAWWQQAEGILAITLAEVMGVIKDHRILNIRDNAIKFYFDYFPDSIHGGIFASVSRDGKPNTSEAKGSPGKSDYHDVELAHFMVLYSGSEYKEFLNNPYPNEAISGGSAEDSTPEGRLQKILECHNYRIGCTDFDCCH